MSNDHSGSSNKSLPQTRRNILGLTAGTLIPSTVATTSTTAQVSDSDFLGQVEESVSIIHHAGFGRAHGGGELRYRSGDELIIRLEENEPRLGLLSDASRFSFGGDTGRELRVTNTDTGRSVTLSPGDNTERVETGYIALQNFEDPDSDSIFGETLRVRPPDQDEPVTMTASVTGDYNRFPEGIFGGFIIELLDADGNVLGATDERIVGGRYDYDVTLDRQNLQITRHSEVDPNWNVEFSVHGGEYITVDNNPDSDNFNIDLTDLNVDPGTYHWFLGFSRRSTEHRNWYTTDTVDGTDARNAVLTLTRGPQLELDADGSWSLVEDGGAGLTQFVPGDGATDSPLLIGGGGVATVGAGYLAYKKLQDDDEEQHTDPTPTSSSLKKSVPSPDSSSEAVSIDQYTELNLGDPVDQHPTTEIRQATVGSHPVWVLTPTGDDGTIDTSHLTQFIDEVEPWTNMDEHEHLLSVYGYGEEPLPWVAVEPADGSLIHNKTAELETEEAIELVIQACEAVHHVQRYGQAYEHLSPESVLIEDASARLRGVVDEVISDEYNYELPDPEENPTTEQADVYRLGALAYEVLTGSEPDHSDLTLSKSDSSFPSPLDEVLSTALAADPDDRYETVLHLRDDLRDRMESI